jgi:hypothetical protein
VIVPNLGIFGINMLNILFEGLGTMWDGTSGGGVVPNGDDGIVPNGGIRVVTGLFPMG